MEGSIVDPNLVTIFYKLLTGRKNSLHDLASQIYGLRNVDQLLDAEACPIDGLEIVSELLED